jgi:4-amino-4-deoxy-L-arabinose transferase-like glycosyltransferase
MSNRQPISWSSFKWFIIVGVGLLTLYLGIYFLIVFVPVVIYFLWDYHSRIQELEKRLADKQPSDGTVVTDKR